MMTPEQLVEDLLNGMTGAELTAKVRIDKAFAQQFAESLAHGLIALYQSEDPPGTPLLDSLRRLLADWHAVPTTTT